MTDSELRNRIRQALDQSMPPLPDDPALTEAVLERHEERRQKRRARMRGLRVVVAMTVMTLFVFGGAIMQGWSRTYFTTYQSEDGEQHIIRGVNVTPPVGQAADAADASNHVIIFNTRSLDDVIDAMGEALMLPTWLPDGWEVDDYSVVINDNIMKDVSVAYQRFKPGEEEADRLIYSVTTFSDLQYFYLSIETNNDGRYVELENGLSVYIGRNVHRPTSMWQEGLTGYVLSGDITEEELLHIIRSMYGLD